MFEKEHKIVMRDIRELDCGDVFNECKIALISYKDSMNREKPEYLMTRDGFTLLAMGFTCTKAMPWKIKYAEAFEKL